MYGVTFVLHTRTASANCWNMLRTLVLALTVAAAAAQRSPNADLVEELLRKQAGPAPGARYSDNILQDALYDVVSA